MNEGNPNPTAPQGDSNWHYAPTQDPQYIPPSSFDPTPQPPVQEEVTWTASEFIAHHKGVGWYGLLALVVVVLALGVHLLTHDTISVVVIVALAILFGFSAARKPRVLTYHLDRSGLTIGPKFYPYSDFKSFSVLHEGPLSSITFMPMKRFMPAISVYYDTKDEDAIANVLVNHLPFEQQGHDIIDRIARHIRF